VRRLLLAVVAGAALAGCGAGSGSSSSSGSSPASASSSGSSPGSTPTTATATRTTRARSRRSPRRSAGVPAHAAPVGRTQPVHAGSSILSVTVTKVYGALAGTGASLPPGTRAAGVQLTIHDDRGATYDSTASGDVSVITSSGAAAPLFIKQGGCQTQLTDFESLIAVGETHSGCVGFAIARRARVIGVRFSPHSRGPGSVTWRCRGSRSGGLEGRRQPPARATASAAKRQSTQRRLTGMFIDGTGGASCLQNVSVRLARSATA
jgi:hypothetical protein